MATVEHLVPEVGAVWEGYAVERNLHAGPTNFASQHGVGAEGEEYSLGFLVDAVDVEQLVAEPFLFGEWKVYVDPHWLVHWALEDHTTVDEESDIRANPASLFEELAGHSGVGDSDFLLEGAHELLSVAPDLFVDPAAEVRVHIREFAARRNIAEDKLAHIRGWQVLTGTVQVGHEKLYEPGFILCGGLHLTDRCVVESEKLLGKIVSPKFTVGSWNRPQLVVLLDKDTRLLVVDPMGIFSELRRVPPSEPGAEDIDIVLEHGHGTFEGGLLGYAGHYLAVEGFLGSLVSKVAEADDDTLLGHDRAVGLSRGIGSFSELSIPVVELPLLGRAVWVEACEVGELILVRAFRMDKLVVNDAVSDDVLDDDKSDPLFRVINSFVSSADVLKVITEGLHQFDGSWLPLNVLEWASGVELDLCVA